VAGERSGTAIFRRISSATTRGRRPKRGIFLTTVFSSSQRSRVKTYRGRRGHTHTHTRTRARKHHQPPAGVPLAKTVISVVPNTIAGTGQPEAIPVHAKFTNRYPPAATFPSNLLSSDKTIEIYPARELLLLRETGKYTAEMLTRRYTGIVKSDGGRKRFG